jgi:hypothetical protein
MTRHLSGHNADHLERLQAEVADVQLPPPEALAGRNRIKVVIVVPAFA